jgi:opacity protein-like surface antigen
MNRSRSSVLQASLLALAAVCGLQSAFDAHAQGASPPPGKALVVLYRSDKQPVAARIPIIANADRLGDLGNGEFVNAVVNPGRTFLRAGDRILTTLALQTSAGQTYYVLLEAVPGMTPVRAEMREMTAGSASRALAQSRPAAGAAASRAPAAAAPLAAAPVAAAAARPPAPVQPAPAAAPPRQVQAPPPPKPAPPPPPKPAPPPPTSEQPREPSDNAGVERGWEFALIAKGGAFNLASVNQTIGGLDSTYEKKSKPAFGLEAEMRNEEGFALGAEVFYYKNTLTPNGTTLQATQTAIAAMANAKYYFEAASWLYPFIGGGLGYAGTTFGGDFTGSTGGFAYQGMLGADLRFSSVGLYLEYKYLGATTADKNSQTVKIGGTGFLAGISIAF